MSLAKQQYNLKKQLNALCAQAVQQQVIRGEATPAQRRLRRRFLLKHLLKRLPKSAQHSPGRLIRSALAMLALWGFSGLVLPNTALAAASFEHVMLEGFSGGDLAKPAFVDIDNDGDLDAFVGNSLGKIDFYRNTGSAITASFIPADGSSVINPFDGVDVGRNAAIAFVDVDGDGDQDAFIGDNNGTINFYQNTGTVSAPVFSPADGNTIINPMAAVDVGQFAAPVFADIDNDGDQDVFVGSLSGTVFFYQNTGTSLSPVFTPADGNTIVNPLGGFTPDVLSSPTLIDIDSDGDLDVFIGDNSGTIKLYQNQGSISAPNFVAADNVSVINPFNGLDLVYNATPVFTDIDNDGDADVFIGPSGGPVRFFRNSGTASAAEFDFDEVPLATANVINSAMPTFADIDGDGDLDAFIGQYDSPAGITFYQNNGTSSVPDFVAADGVSVINPLASYSEANSSFVAFADIDSDGDLDAFIGQYGGTVKFLSNQGTATLPNFVEADGSTIVNPLLSVAVNGYAAPAFVDIDNDGDLDAFVGSLDGSVKYYQNQGSASTPDFVAADGVSVINPLMITGSVSRATPAFADLDHDGDLDVIVGNSEGNIYYYQNQGSNTQPSFVAADGSSIINPLQGFDFGKRITPFFADIDDDGDQDLFIGEAGGSVRLLENREPPASSSGSSSSGGGGSFGLNLLAALAALTWRRRRIRKQA